MKILPAIDLRGGQCVRLRQGDYSQETVFSRNPVEMARHWQDQGGDILHLVDLDGAKAGHPINQDIIAEIAHALTIPCQLGGGLRTEKDIEGVFEIGVSRAIVGTQAVRDPGWFRGLARRFPDRLILGLDAKNGMVATDGWLETATTSAVELLGLFADLPLAAIVYTDIAKDGMMAGPNIEMTARLQQSCPIQVIASGGITTVDDVLELQRHGIGACILGRSIYEGVIQLPDLRARLRA